MDEAGTWHGGRPQPRRICVRLRRVRRVRRVSVRLCPKRGRVPSPILRVEVENFEIGLEVGELPVITNFVALEKQRILVKTRSESV